MDKVDIFAGIIFISIIMPLCATGLHGMFNADNDKDRILGYTLSVLVFTLMLWVFLMITGVVP